MQVSQNEKNLNFQFKIIDNDNSQITGLIAYIDKIGNNYQNSISYNLLNGGTTTAGYKYFTINTGEYPYNQVFDDCGDYEFKVYCVDGCGEQAYVGNSGSNNENNKVFYYTHIISNSFTPNTNGWNFSNYGTQPSWDAYVMAYGNEYCYITISGETYRNPVALLHWQSLQFLHNGGSCFGFATSAQMAFDNVNDFKNDYPNLSFSNAIHELALDEDARTCIGSLWISQWRYPDNLQSMFFSNKNPTTTLSEVKVDINTNDRSVLYLVYDQIYFGIHAVTPFKTECDPSNDNIEYIYIYIYI